MKRLYNLPKLHSFTFLGSWFYWKSFVIFFLSCLFTIHLTLLTDEGEVARKFNPKKREIALLILFCMFPWAVMNLFMFIAFFFFFILNEHKKNWTPCLGNYSRMHSENQTNIKYQRGIIGNKTLECERSAIQNMMKQFYATLHKCPFRLQWFPPLTSLCRKEGIKNLI